jgi:hypothetical protein
VTISFGDTYGGGSRTIAGSIDRVTGDVDAGVTLADPKTRHIMLVTNYSLKCKPTQRMF